jgi:hypothetical protein
MLSRLEINCILAHPIGNRAAHDHIYQTNHPENLPAIFVDAVQQFSGSAGAAKAGMGYHQNK